MNKIFLRFLFLSLLLIFISSYQIRAESYPVGDGEIQLFNYHLNEFAKITFKKNGIRNPQAMEQLGHLLRSRDNNDAASIDPRLMDLIDHLQDHFDADTLEIISGYRRKEFNEALLHSGHTVSPVSFHIQGRALDIHIDEIREETLRDYLLGLRLGGVGYYGPLDFIHIDTGPVRRWGDGTKSPRKLVGVFAPQSSFQLTSDKNDYLPGDPLHFEWQIGPSGFGAIRNLRIERFWRGKWESCRAKISSLQKFDLSPESIQCLNPEIKNRFGKYRWLFEIEGPEGSPGVFSSNEFYLKKE